VSVLEVRDLTVTFAQRGGPAAAAVDGVSLTLRAGQTLALVGESGCTTRRRPAKLQRCSRGSLTAARCGAILACGVVGAVSRGPPGSSPGLAERLRGVAHAARAPVSRC
jgi:hypothetical protein